MDIKRAKEEIKDVIEAYLAKDELGEYRIPLIRQRPVLLIGPPGVGKTQIMEQVARECRIALVSYTITHHTRQSAVGLPFIREKSYGGKVYSVTEYTMSEIIASVYDKMEQTGLKEGILFIDEINCVSETLAPTMLKFLQEKTFGNHRVPEGWIIVAAGNPPEYNKSVREFDIVTLDRLKTIHVEPNLDVWMEYAYKQHIHPAIISYLNLRKNHFYRVETTVDGKNFVTARGWEDLSNLIQTYEILGKKVDREIAGEYLQHAKTAKDFANYLELYYKYQDTYGIEDILEQKFTKLTVQKLSAAAFDEKLSVIGLLNGRLDEDFISAYEEEMYVERLYSLLLPLKENPALFLTDVLDDFRSQYETAWKEERLDRQEKKIWTRVLSRVETMNQSDKADSFDKIREMFAVDAGRREEILGRTQAHLEAAFLFLETVFGDSQEMVAFLTGINANYYAVWFIQENGCDLYYRYNKGMLFEKRQQEILNEINEIAF